MVSSSSVLNTRGCRERLVQALGHRVDAALLRDVLAEQQRFGILGEQVVQRVVDLDREVARRLFLRQLRLAAEHLARRLSAVGRAWPRRCTASGVYGASGAMTSSSFVRRGRRSASSAAAKHFCRVSSYSARISSFDISPDSSAIARRTQQRIAGLHRAQFLDRTPFDLEVGAGVAHDARRAQVQERRAARACGNARPRPAPRRSPSARSRPSAKK